MQDLLFVLSGSGESEVQDMTVEKVKDIIIHENDIESCIYDICEQEGIDIKKAKQGEWRYILRAAGNRLFRNTDILKDKSIVYGQGNIIPSNNNRYNYDKVNQLCDYYISISDKYNKLVSILAFSYLSCIDDTTIDKWGSDPSCGGFGIWQKLINRRQDSLKDKLFDSSNPVGAMSIGNTEFKWNLPGVHNRQDQRQTAPSIPDMARKYGVEQTETGEFPQLPKVKETEN